MHSFAIVLVPEQFEDRVGRAMDMLLWFGKCRCFEFGEAQTDCPTCQALAELRKEWPNAKRDWILDWFIVGGRYDGLINGLTPELLEPLRQPSKPTSEGGGSSRPQTDDDLDAFLEWRDTRNTASVRALPQPLQFDIILTPELIWFDRRNGSMPDFRFHEDKSRTEESDTQFDRASLWTSLQAQILAEHDKCVGVAIDIHYA